MNSQEFFAQFRGQKELGPELSKVPQEHLELWEQEPVSQHSPGPVHNDEIVYQQILDPTNLDETGTALSPMAFNSATSIGMSTNRISYSDWPTLIARGEKRAAAYNATYPEAAQRSMWGFVPLPVQVVRSIVSRATGQRGLFVFDTANLDDPSHADILQCVKDPKTFRSVRHQLYDLVKGSILPISAVV